MADKAQETITKYLGDMHALEAHGLQPIGRQCDNLKDDDHPEALQFAREAKQVLEQHIAALESRLKALGGSPTSPVKDAASTVAGVFAGVYNAVRSEEASKSIRDDYTFFSNCAIAYLMLHTTSKGLGDSQTAQLAERGYRDCARLVMHIDRIMPGLVIAELRQDGLTVQDVSDECRKMVHDAWNRDAASTMGMGASGMGTSGMGSSTLTRTGTSAAMGTTAGNTLPSGTAGIGHGAGTPGAAASSTPTMPAGSTPSTGRPTTRD